MLKKLCLLTALLLTANLAQAQVFAPQQNGAASTKQAQTKPVAKTNANTKSDTASNASSNSGENTNSNANSDEKPFFDENGAPNYVVRNFAQSENKEKQYDNSERKVFTLKMVNGDIVINDKAPRSILISYEDYKINKSFDNWIRCSIRVYVLNDLTEQINNFSFKLHWPEMNATVQMNRLNPGVRTYKDIVLLGEGCFNMDKVPTIEVNRCRVKGMTQDQCADAVKWFQSKK